MSPSTTKFLTTTNSTPTKPKVTKAPILARKLSLKVSNGTNVLIYGSSGSGKTYTIVEMLRLGAKVFLLSTDFGESGADTIRNAFIGTPEANLLDNIYEICLSKYDDVAGFLASPCDYAPELFNEFKPDVLFWDGFSFFQSSILTQKVGELTDHKKEVSEARDDGFLLEAMDWGMVKTKTLQTLNSFLTIRNPTTGESPLHFVSCLSDIKLKSPGSVTEGSKVIESRKPLLQGAGGVLSAAAFSLVLQTKVTASSDVSKRTYSYITQGHDALYAKNRGFNLQPEEFSFSTIWKELTKK